MPYFEDDQDPKKPRPIHRAHKSDGSAERAEARKDDERDSHRHVHSIVRC